MTFMKKDVNLGLLVLIIASVLLFSGFSVYYQTAFKDVSLEYQEKLGQLSDVTKQLSSKRQELNETYSQRLKKEQGPSALPVTPGFHSWRSVLTSSRAIDRVMCKGDLL